MTIESGSILTEYCPKLEVMKLNRGN